MKKRMFLSLLVVVMVVVVYFVLHPFSYLLTDKYKKNASLEIVGHKGASGLAPENTIAAIRMGLKKKVNMVEIDVHLTADNAIVVCHDETIDRTTTGSGEIRKLTLSEIRAVSIRVDDSITALKIPTLQEVIDCVSTYPSGKLLIELKYGSSHYPKIEQKI
jgi:glycerophosphoryl diester phosphodiesterase